MRRACIFAGSMLLATAAHADEQAPATAAHQRLRDRYGVEVAARLLRSVDPEERLRGIARAAEIAAPLAAGPETCKSGGPPNPICEEAKRALELLTPADTQGALHGDSRSLLALARALAPFAAHAQARATLVYLVNQTALSVGRGQGEGEPDVMGRTMLARAAAAMALASSHDTRAIEQLVSIARGGGIGQQAAATALSAHGLSFWSPAMAPPTSALSVQAMVQSGDLRVLDLLRAATRATDVQTRAAALLGMAQLGDGRAVDLARSAIGEKDARLRSAAAEVFVLLDAGERFRAVEALIKDDVTAAAGVRLAERAQDDGVIQQLAARAVATADHALRQAIVRALGMGTLPKAVAVLQALGERDPSLESDIAQAIARSPSAVALGAIERMAEVPTKRRLALRAYFVRRMTRGDSSDALDRMLSDAARSRDVRDRAVAVPALVALGKLDAASALGDVDPAVRRAVALAVLAVDPERSPRLLLDRLANEKDALTRVVFAAGLRNGDPDGIVTTSELLLRAQSGAADSSLAALALAQRASDAPGAEPLDKPIHALLASPVASVRAHTALGLGASKLPSAPGTLAELYAFEVDPEARRCAIVALGMREWQSAPIARRTIEVAAKLDPDDDVRFAASRILLGLRPPTAALVREVAWLHAAAADGGAAPKGLSGTLVPKHGIAIPFAFDDEGFALIPGVPIGEATVVLAPRVSGSKP